MMDITIRKLTKRHKDQINEIQKQRGFVEIDDSFFESQKVLYGAFHDDRLVSMAALYLYHRLPCSDYPHGFIAELGSVYTIPEYRFHGIATMIITVILDSVKKDWLLLDAIVVDSTDDACNMYEKLGFKYSTEHRQWFVLNKY